ncbi:Inner membrane ABC transporter permease protein yejE [Bartonella clarridgeiae 73]|uniref:Inner membrane ABC transporter permease protein yejE n=2 Tax=Bartonella clarridgeiae TaxID=56426 RepID=E6YG73_BARC7|nr:MAG: ABC transporter permease protein 2 (cluster 5 nickel/peptides/opines) [Bartonella clarridgeiae]CBI75861.1 Inner membrane ABC transporter permease protein yejE [Bartonella clarridgeiae 73]
MEKERYNRLCNDKLKRWTFLSPLNAHRWHNFKQNRRGWWSLWFFLFLCVCSFLAEFIANDRPIIVSYKEELLFPIFFDYPDEKFGGNLAKADFRDPFIQNEIAQHGWAFWPLVRYSYNTVVGNKTLALAPPFWLQSKEERCISYAQGSADPECTINHWNWLGTDDLTRDIFARVLYGFRVSIIFSILLTVISAIIGITAGAVQGYFGGWIDLICQRLIEIWSSVPSLYLVIIMAAVLAQGFWMLLGVMLLFQWVVLVGVVRAEFLRARNFTYISAARALGVPDRIIMMHHLLPNAMVAALTYLPFLLTSGISLLTSLDYLGFGLPPGYASLGEVMRQATSNLNAPWIGITGFVVIAVILSLLAFIGEAARDAFDPRKIK